MAMSWGILAKVTAGEKDCSNVVVLFRQRACDYNPRELVEISARDEQLKRPLR